MKILIVDDEPAIVEFLKQGLGKPTIFRRERF